MPEDLLVLLMHTEAETSVMWVALHQSQLHDQMVGAFDEMGISEYVHELPAIGERLTIGDVIFEIVPLVLIDSAGIWGDIR